MPDGIQGMPASLLPRRYLLYALAVEQANHKEKSRTSAVLGGIAGCIACLLNTGQYLLVAIVIFLAMLGVFYTSLPRFKQL